MTDILSVRTVAIPVTDQDRAVTFYAGTLGLDLRLDAPVPEIGGRWIELGPPDASTTVALVPASADLPAGVATGIRFHVSDATALHARLDAAGVAVGDLLNWPGVPTMFVVHDPDTNTLTMTEEPS